ncbi:MAG: hypothetical protein M3Z04_11805 [Chloroflexota bacterium]|nr:hypothetical protein [Chloroflexota bacterium]
MTNARAAVTGLLLHCALAIFYTWPLLLNFGGTGLTPGAIIEDRDQNLWNLWWVKTALLDLHTNPFHTDQLYWPTGVSLQFHTLNPFNGLISIPFQPFVSLPVIYNGIVLFSFILTGWGAYLLLRYLLAAQPGDLVGAEPARTAAAAVGSSIFAYSAYHLATQRGLLQLISLEWVPLAVLGLMQAVHAAPRWADWPAFGRWLLRRAVPAAFFLVLVALVDWYYVMYTLLFTGFYGLYLLGRALLRPARNGADSSWGARLRPLESPARIAISVGLFFVAVAPLLLPMFAELRTATYMRPAAGVAVENSADLVAFFAPPRIHQLWGRLSAFRLQWPFGANTYEVYLGYTTLALAGLGLGWRRRPNPPAPFPTKEGGEDGRPNPPAPFPTKEGGEDVGESFNNSTLNTQHSTLVPLPSRAFWAGAAGIFFTLALGPQLQVNGVPQAWAQPMPYTLIERIPGLNISRSPDRFAMPLMLCLSVLAGYGVLRLVAALARRGRGGGGMVGGLAAGLLALLALEVWPVPVPQLPAPIPAFYTQLGHDPSDYAILELPREDSYWHGAFRMYFQTAHHKRIFSGYISREFYHPFLWSTPGFMELQNPDGLGDLFADGPDQWLSALADSNTRYVVLYKAGWRPEPAKDETALYRAALTRVLGAAVVAQPVHSDSDLDLYAVPAPAQRVPYLALGGGWAEREATPAESHRWIRNVGTLEIHSPVPWHGQLVFQANTLRDPRPLAVSCATNPATTLTIDGAPREYRVDLGQIPAGLSVVSLTSAGPVPSPKELGMNEDARLLGVAFSKVALERLP